MKIQRYNMNVKLSWRFKDLGEKSSEVEDLTLYKYFKN